MGGIEIFSVIDMRVLYPDAIQAWRSLWKNNELHGSAVLVCVQVTMFLPVIIPF